MTAQDYPITQGYGYDPTYPLNGGNHLGIDYGCPTGTNIVVNGVVIGLSGNTGTVTGPHLHVGRWVNGKATDPGVGGGFHFNSAQVTEIGQDSVNGKFVRVQGDGASWVYLHMSDNSKIKVGQILQGDDMLTPGQLDKLIKAMKQAEPNAAELNDTNWKNNPGLAIDTLWEFYGKNHYPPVTDIKPYDGPPLYLKKG